MNEYVLCESRVQMQVGSIDTRHSWGFMRQRCIIFVDYSFHKKP